MTGEATMNTYRTTAKVVGVIYLAGFVVGIAGDMLIQSTLGASNHLATVSAHSMTLAIGAILWLLAVVGDAAHGIVMFPVLKPRNERIAVGYLGFRIIDAVFIAVMVLFALLQIPLGSEYMKAASPDTLPLQALSTVSARASQYAYEIGMIAVGLAGLLLCSTLYKAKLVPQPVAVWGIVGYAILLCGMVSAVMGSGLGLVSSIPGGLWELFIGVWLIAKGFSSPARIAESAHVAINAGDTMRVSVA